jgi:hypothetical protein
MAASIRVEWLRTVAASDQGAGLGAGITGSFPEVVAVEGDGDRA